MTIAIIFFFVCAAIVAAIIINRKTYTKEVEQMEDPVLTELDKKIVMDNFEEANIHVVWFRNTFIKLNDIQFEYWNKFNRREKNWAFGLAKKGKCFVIEMLKEKQAVR
jgi:hypothetical protein